MERLPELTSQTNVQSAVGVALRLRGIPPSRSADRLGERTWQSFELCVKLSGHMMTFDLRQVSEKVTVLKELVSAENVS